MLLVDIKGVGLTNVFTSHRWGEVPSGSVGWCVLPIFWLCNFTDFQNTVINRALSGESGPIDWGCRVIFMQYFKVTSIKRTTCCLSHLLPKYRLSQLAPILCVILRCIVTFRKSWILNILIILILNILMSCCSLSKM